MIPESPTLHWMVWRTGVANDDAQARPRGLPGAQSAGLARAQGCLAPRAGASILALGAVDWGWDGLGGCGLESRVG